MPSFVPGHTPGHLACPACEASRRDTLPPANLADLRFSDAAENWLTEHATEVGERTLRNYRNYLHFLAEFFDGMPLRSIHIGHIQQYQAWRQKPRFDERSHRTWAAGYSPINHEISALAQVLARAGLWKELERFYRPLKQPKTRVGCALDQGDQERLFLVASRNPRWKVAYLASLLTANTSAGPGEIRHLHLSDIRLQHRGGDGEPMPMMVIRDGLKNEHRDREMFLNPTAVMAARTLLKRAAKLGCVDPNDYLLPHRASKAGDGWDPKRPMLSWKTAWRALRTAAGQPRLRMYDLRHHIITRLLEDPDVSEQTVQEIVGHVPGRTKDRYSHIRMARKRDALMAAETKAPTQITLFEMLPEKRGPERDEPSFAPFPQMFHVEHSK